MTGLSDADRESLWESMERAYLDTTTRDRASEDAIETAVEAIVARHVAETLTEAADAIAQAEPSWHRGMYGCPDDMFTRRSLTNLVRLIRARIPN